MLLFPAVVSMTGQYDQQWEPVRLRNRVIYFPGPSYENLSFRSAEGLGRSWWFKRPDENSITGKTGGRRICLWCESHHKDTGQIFSHTLPGSGSFLHSLSFRDPADRHKYKAKSHERNPRKMDQPVNYRYFSAKTLPVYRYYPYNNA